MYIHTQRRRSFIFTFALCLVTVNVATGYLVRWGRSDAVVTTSVSLVATVAAAGMVANAMAIWRER